MKVLFIFKSDFIALPLSMMTLSSCIKAHGHETAFIDMRFEIDYKKKIKAFKPDVLAYTLVSFDWKYFQKLNLEIKEYYPAFSVFGGPHTTICTEFINEDGVDAICIGEGEFAFIELLNKIENKQGISNIENIWVKYEGKVIKNDLRPLISDLDTIPFPDIELIKAYHFYREMGMYYIMTSRGCPFNCSYCINHYYRRIYKDKGIYLRRRTVDNVIEELIHAKKLYNIKLIVFNDDIFTLDKGWLTNFEKLYKDKIGLPFEAYTRVGQVDEEIVDLLKRMGCRTIILGIESGNENLRHQVLNRKISNKDIIETAALFKQKRIKINASNMLCLPDETLDNAFETVIINAKAKIDYPLFFVFKPFPNIEMTRYAIEKKYFDGHYEDLQKGLSYGKSIIQLKDSKKISRLRYLSITGSKYPFLLGLISILVKLPFDFIYKIIFMIQRVYIQMFILKRPVFRALFYYYLKWPIISILRGFSKYKSV